MTKQTKSVAPAGKKAAAKVSTQPKQEATVTTKKISDEEVAAGSPFHKILIVAGFKFVAARPATDGVAYGYQSDKGGAALVVQGAAAGDSWSLACGDYKASGTATNRVEMMAEEKALRKALHAIPATKKHSGFEKGSGCYKCRACGKQTRDVGHDAVNVGLCAECWEQAGDENAVLDGQMTQAEYDAKWKADAKAAHMVELSAKAAKRNPAPTQQPSTPGNVVRAVEILGGMTLQRFDLDALSNEKSYSRRVTLLKRLFKTEKVLVKDSTIAKLREAFYSAVGVGAGTIAAKKEEFARRCKAIAAAERTAKAKAKKEEKEAIAAAMRATVLERTVPGEILPGSPRKTKKQLADEMEETKEHVRRQLVLAATADPIAAPKPDAEVTIVADDVHLLEDPKNGIVMLQLERANSQGAICVYNNGSRVAAGVVPPEILKTLRSLDLSGLKNGLSSHAVILQAVNQLLNPIVTSVPVTPVAASHLTAVLNCKEMQPMSATSTVTPNAKTSKFAAPTAAKKTSAAKAEKPAKAEKTTKAAKAEKPATKKNAPAPRAAAFADTAVIKCLVKENPFRGTLAERFANILDGKAKTVADYKKKTDRYPDLGFFVKKEAISIK